VAQSVARLCQVITIPRINYAKCDLAFLNYDTSIGRFMQVDPLAILDNDLTPYHYGRNNPIAYTDPLGLTSVFWENGDLVIDMSGDDYGGSWSSDGDDGSHHYRSYKSADEGRDRAVDYYNKYSTDDHYEPVYGITHFEARSSTASITYGVVGYKLVPGGLSGDGNGGQQSDQQRSSDDANYPRTTFEVLHSANDSFGWDWFVETTQHSYHYYTQTAVIITYNTNPKDWGTSRYGKVVSQTGKTRSLIMDAGGVHPNKDLPYDPSQLMKDFIQGAKNYHCGGCLSTPTPSDKYLDFIFRKDRNVDFWGRPKTRPTGNGVHR
jgi:hypothetical protein